MLLICSILALSLIYFLLKSNYQYWKKYGVPGPDPKFFVGNLGQSFFLKKSPPEVYTEIYRKYPDSPVVGLYRAFTPILLVRDPEVIKEVTIRSFNHFRDNDVLIEKDADPLFGRHPFVLKGDEWKLVRSQLTSGFTSGKMKWIYPHLEETSLRLVKFIEQQPDALNGNGYDSKELCTRFTLDNVASCAFGIEGKCFEEDKSEFRHIAENFLTPGGWTVTVFFLLALIPKLSKFVSIRFVKKDVEDKLTNIVSQALKYREENNIVRNDFLHVLGELRRTCKDYDYTDLDVTAHAAGFFTDGYETSSLIMTFILFELAANPKAQSKLREEVEKGFAENKVSYEKLQEMEYLDAVVNESLRLHPAGFALQKVCTSPYTYTNKESGHSLVIEKGTPIILPTYGLHTDPKYFEEPESFQPERFLGANKEKILKCTFMPFGEGPRSCLGQRFGLLQVKIGVAYIVKNYMLSVNKKTQLPIRYDPINVMAMPVGKLWIDFQKIN